MVKFIRIVTVALFAAIVAIPLIFLNTTPNAVSSIDNRTLTENPFTLEGSLASNIDSYINDRLGFRDEMITAYTVINDRAFGKMVHPSYEYGKDGYVFGAGLTTSNDFGDFHIAFADMVAAIQTYCEDRDVPFLFVFNPAKPAVYQDKLPIGMNYNRDWVDLFFKELDKRDVYYVDNTDTLVELRAKGIDGFNQKYDANHWNDLGAFYGTKKILEQMQELCPTIHVNSIEEFTVTEKLETSLPVSKFPIHEYVPTLSADNVLSSLYDDYFTEIDINPAFQSFGYYVNESASVSNTPKALIFHGSYMNGHGSKYMRNAFREYVHVHDYQNVINFPYFFNIFQPEFVVFEVAEYTFLDSYFSHSAMSAIDYNPALSNLEETLYSSIDISNEEISVEHGKTLTTITWHTDHTYRYVWMELDNVYDMQPIEGGYQLTVERSRFEEAVSLMSLFVL